VSEGVAVDAAGNIYFTQLSPFFNGFSAVYKVSTNGHLTIFAGGGALSGNFGDAGPATSAALNMPLGIAIDAAGNVYIADAGANRIRKVSTTNTVTTVAGPGSTDGNLGDGGPAVSATLSQPARVAVDSSGNLYIADAGHNRIRKVSPDGIIRTVAGNGLANAALGDGGAATSASLSAPGGVAVDVAGNIYISDTGHNRIRKVTPAGIISTVAGNGAGEYSGDGGLATIAAIWGPTDLALDAAGNIYFGDYFNNRVREITADGNINTIAGNGVSGNSGDGGPATGAATGRTLGIALASGGKILVSQARRPDWFGC
jgi:sugar lactone lactonase YvrE